jgi:hypothetical protein
MADEGPESAERPAEQTAEQAATPASDRVTSEFVAGVQQPSTSANGFGAEAEIEPAFDEHPEYVVGGAFLGGLLLGRFVRRLGR